MMYDLKTIEANLKARGAIYRETGEDGGRCIINYKGTPIRMQYSWGLDWEHVSISTEKRCPTWNEMCFVKELFWKDDEWCVQYHPAKEDYVNLNPYCLHIFRPISVELPKPMKCMV